MEGGGFFLHTVGVRDAVTGCGQSRSTSAMDDTDSLRI